jgi:GTPase SAR1 family protein
VILLIGNKEDLPQREVKQSRVEEMLSNNKSKIVYMETSALTGHNVNDAFKTLV